MQLYLDGQTSVQIAETVGVSVQTLSSWKQKDNWDKMKMSVVMTKPIQLTMLYEQLNALSVEIKSREKPYAIKGEADTIAKLTAAIRSLEIETSLAATIDVSTRLLEYVRKIDLEKAKEIAQIVNSFVRSEANK